MVLQLQLSLYRITVATAAASHITTLTATAVTAVNVVTHAAITVAVKFVYWADVLSMSLSTTYLIFNLCLVREHLGQAEDTRLWMHEEVSHVIGWNKCKLDIILKNKNTSENISCRKGVSGQYKHP